MLNAGSGTQTKYGNGNGASEPIMVMELLSNKRVSARNLPLLRSHWLHNDRSPKHLFEGNDFEALLFGGMSRRNSDSSEGLMWHRLFSFDVSISH